MNIRTATWEAIGSNISSATSVEEALRISHLDYTVEKVPVFLQDGTPIPGAFCTKKEGTEETFGVVGSQFEIIQNQEALSFVDNLVSEGLTFVKAGENHKMLYLIGKLPNIEVLGDEITPYLIFQNSHNGSTTLKATIAPLRVVCQNQFSITFKKAANKISIRHTESIKGRLHTAQQILLQNTEYLSEFQKQALGLAQEKVTKKQVDTLLDGIFEIKPEFNPTQFRRVEEKRERFLAAYQADDNQNFLGTKWGLINAYTDFVTHKPLRKETPQALENHFIKTTLKGSMNEFIHQVSKL